jgi:hypothetical protein
MAALLPPNSGGPSTVTQWPDSVSPANVIPLTCLTTADFSAIATPFLFFDARNRNWFQLDEKYIVAVIGRGIKSTLKHACGAMKMVTILCGPWWTRRLKKHIPFNEP